MKDTRYNIDNSIQDYFQVIVSATSVQDAYNAELLVRQQQGDNILPPNKLLQTLREKEQMFDLFKDMFARACAFVSIGRFLTKPINISINLDEQTLSSPRLIPYINKAIEWFDVNPASFKLEIMERNFESALPPRDVDIIYNHLSHLQASGFKLSMDDFGTESSSGERYFNLQARGIIVDTIKLDRSLMPSVNPASHIDNKLQQYGLLSILENAKQRGAVLSFVLEGADDQDVQYYRELLDGHIIDVQSFNTGRPNNSADTYAALSSAGSLNLKSQKQNDLRQYA